eukprot:5502391-Pyramimonas_sp.AAC.1
MPLGRPCEEVKRCVVQYTRGTNVRNASYVHGGWIRGPPLSAPFRSAKVADSGFGSGAERASEPSPSDIRLRRLGAHFAFTSR